MLIDTRPPDARNRADLPPERYPAGMPDERLRPIWLTSDHDPRDIVLEPGEQFDVATAELRSWSAHWGGSAVLDLRCTGDGRSVANLGIELAGPRVSIRMTAVTS